MPKFSRWSLSYFFTEPCIWVLILNNLFVFNVLKLCTSGNNKTSELSICLYPQPPSYPVVARSMLVSLCLHLDLPTDTFHASHMTHPSDPRFHGVEIGKLLVLHVSPSSCYSPWYQQLHSFTVTQNNRRHCTFVSCVRGMSDSVTFLRRQQISFSAPNVSLNS